MKRILVVDDDYAFARDVGDVIKEMGYDVTVVTNGRDALSLLERERFDLVLLDIIMPGMHGLDVLKEIKGANPLIKVVMLSTQFEKMLVERALQMGADDYLRKPIDVEELNKKISLHLSEEKRVEEERGFKYEDFRTLISEGKLKTEKEILDLLVNTISNLTKAERVTVTLIERESKLLKPVAGKGFEGTSFSGPYMKVGEGIAGKVALTGEPILVRNIEDEKDIPRSIYGYSYKSPSFICVPIKTADGIVGVISVTDKEGGGLFDESDLKVLLNISEQVSFLIESIVLRDEVRKLEEKNLIQSRVYDLLMKSMESVEVYRGITDLTLEYTGGNIAWLVVEEPGTGEFYIESVSGLEFKERIPVKGIYKGPTGKVIYSSTPMTSLEVKVPFGDAELPFRDRVKYWIGSSIVIRERHVGCLFSANNLRGHFLPSEISNLTLISRLTALALKQLWLHENLVKTLDELAEKELEIEELKSKISTPSG